MKALDTTQFVGVKFGRLTPISFYKKTPKIYCKALCDCGVEKDYAFGSLKTGLTKSCGCIRAARPNGLKYEYSYGFFEQLTADSAYVLGLIYTDGSVNNRGFKISLKESDSGVLKNISLLIKNSDRLYRQKGRKSPTSDNLVQDALSVKCDSPKIARDLYGWGLYPSKTHTLKPDERLVGNRDFWRGCIDGDGWISFKNKKYQYLCIGFCGTKEMCEGFVAFCNQHIACTPKLHKRGAKNYYEVSLGGTVSRHIHEVLYNGAGLFIERKCFPDKFSGEAAINRNVAAERVELEK